MYSSRNSIIKKQKKESSAKRKESNDFNESISLSTEKITESIFAWPVLFCLVIAIYLGGSNWTLLQVSCKYSVCVCVYAHLSRKQLLVSIFAVCYVSFCDIDHGNKCSNCCLNLVVFSKYGIHMNTMFMFVVLFLAPQDFD